MGWAVAEWQAAFEQAWLSLGSGNYGIGAVLIDPDRNNAIVASWRNLVVGPSSQEQRIAGNYMAHTDINVFAMMPTLQRERAAPPCGALGSTNR